MLYNQLQTVMPILQELVQPEEIGEATQPYRTCSTEAEIRRHCAFEAPKRINSGSYSRISLAVSSIRSHLTALV
jgi:hypothetical protein